MQPFLASGIFEEFGRLAVDWRSRGQPMEEEQRRENEMEDTSFYTADYYLERERAERALAAKAVSTAIRDIHLEMAERYRDLAEQAARPALSQASG
jgi:hypothetical protein